MAVQRSKAKIDGICLKTLVPVKRRCILYELQTCNGGLERPTDKRGKHFESAFFYIYFSLTVRIKKIYKANKNEAITLIDCDSH